MTINTYPNAKLSKPMNPLIIIFMSKRSYTKREYRNNSVSVPTNKLRVQACTVQATEFERHGPEKKGSKASIRIVDSCTLHCKLQEESERPFVFFKTRILYKGGEIYLSTYAYLLSTSSYEYRQFIWSSSLFDECAKVVVDIG